MHKGLYFFKGWAKQSVAQSYWQNYRALGGGKLPWWLCLYNYKSITSGFYLLLRGRVEGRNIKVSSFDHKICVHYLFVSEMSSCLNTSAGFLCRDDKWLPSCVIHYGWKQDSDTWNSRLPGKTHHVLEEQKDHPMLYLELKLVNCSFCFSAAISFHHKTLGTCVFPMSCNVQRAILFTITLHFFNLKEAITFFRGV